MKLQITTFYGQIKATEKIDIRDNRGKIHEAALVLVQFVLALLCKRDGNLSSIHEHMAMRYEEVVCYLGLTDAPKQCISRAQLPIFLSKIDYELLAFFVLKNSIIAYKQSISLWYALDGKELRGSIKKGSKRGQAIVQAVSHKNREVVCQGYYNGKKESEIPTVRELLEQQVLQGQKITMDALHCNPSTLELISGLEGSFLVGLKGNQEMLCEQMEDFSYRSKSEYERLDEEKGHGREEIRYYLSYDISDLEFDERWEEVNFQTLVRVLRKQKVVKKEESMYEISDYLTNIRCKNEQDAHELFDAVRNHWQVEVNNYIRDTVLKEDKLRTSNFTQARTIACCRTLVLRLLDEFKPKNRRKKLDYFSIKFQECLRSLSAINFL